MDPVTQDATEVRALETAVILADGDLFGESSPSGGQHGVTAATVVGGLPLLTRAVLTVQRAGIPRILILAGPETKELRCALKDDPRITSVVRWILVQEFPPADSRTWEALADEFHGACLVVSAKTIFSVGLVTRLRDAVRQEPAAGQTVWVVPHTEGRSGELLHRAALVVLPATLLRRLEGSRLPGSPALLDAIMDQASLDGRMVRIQAWPPALVGPGVGQWCWSVRDPEGAKRAERLLVQTLKGQYEGFVDTYLNRKLSRLLTRVFLKAGLSPNAVTGLSLLVGLVAAASFAAGSYVTGVIGALLFQLSAVIDCCDGEIARLTFRESRFGEQLDIIGDNVVHMAIFAGIAWAGYSRSGSGLSLLLGMVAMIGNGLSLWWVMRARVQQDRQTWSTPAQTASVDFLLKNLASRDFSIVVLLFALADALGLFLWLAAVGSHLFWIVTAYSIKSSASAPA